MSIDQHLCDTCRAKLNHGRWTEGRTDDRVATCRQAQQHQLRHRYQVHEFTSPLAVMSGPPLSSGSYPSRIIVGFIAAWWFSSPPISSSNLPLTAEEQSSTPHASFRLDIIQLDRSMLIGANPMTSNSCARRISRWRALTRCHNAAHVPLLRSQIYQCCTVGLWNLNILRIGTRR